MQGAGKKVKTGLGFKCDQCGYLFTERRSLYPAFNCDQCGNSYSRSGNLEMHKISCTGPTVAPGPKRRRTASAVPKFTVRRKKRALGSTSEMYEVDMKESDNLTALQGAVTSFRPSMSTSQVGKGNPKIFTGIFYANLISQLKSRNLYTLLWSVIEYLPDIGLNTGRRLNFIILTH